MAWQIRLIQSIFFSLNFVLCEICCIVVCSSCDSSEETIRHKAFEAIIQPLETLSNVFGCSATLWHVVLPVVHFADSFALTLQDLLILAIFSSLDGSSFSLLSLALHGLFNLNFGELVERHGRLVVAGTENLILILLADLYALIHRVLVNEDTLVRVLVLAHDRAALVVLRLRPHKVRNLGETLLL